MGAGTGKGEEQVGVEMKTMKREQDGRRVSKEEEEAEGRVGRGTQMATKLNQLTGQCS